MDPKVPNTETVSDSEPVSELNHPGSPDEAVPSDSETAADMPPEQSRLAALYDTFTERAREAFDAGQEKSKEALEKAMETARVQLQAAGEAAGEAAGKFSAEQGEAFKQFMRRDLDQTARDFKEIGKEAGERLHPARLGAGALSTLAKLMDATGTLTCTQCGKKLQLKRTAHIPPCPSCKGTEFRKGY